MMADLEFEDFEGDYSAPMTNARIERARRYANIAGAVCSVTLVLGLAVWGYKLAVRDVTGVPVMRAALGPMRIAPADPGGDQTSNQGLSVNAIAAYGTSAPPPDQLTLAPGAVELQPGDEAGLTLASGSKAPATQAALSEVKLKVSGLAQPGVATATAATVTEKVPLNDGVGTLTDETVITDLSASTPADAQTGSQVATDLVVKVADSHVMRPHARPALQQASAGGVAGNTPGLQAATEVDAATLAQGTRLAQLGAFESPDLAREKFAALQGQFGDLMRGKNLVIQAAQSGGQTFYRLRALGFAGEDDARRFCAALQAASADCIPVAQR